MLQSIKDLTKGQGFEASILLERDHVLATAEQKGHPVIEVEGRIEVPSFQLLAAFSATFLGQYVGKGARLKALNLNFERPAVSDLAIQLRLELLEILTPQTVRARGAATQGGAVVFEGEFDVTLPDQFAPLKNSLPAYVRGRRFDALIEKARASGAPLPVAVVWPTDAESFLGAHEAAQAGLILPHLVGPEQDFRDRASALGIDLSNYQLHAAEDEDGAARLAVDLVRNEVCRGLMKGHLHTDTFLHPILRAENGLKTRRRLSHVFVFDAPHVDHLFLVSDAAINIAPDLSTKVDIVQNAIDLAHSLGMERPKVGILSAVETVTLSMPSTLDAAILCKMAERGQITGADLDGPLALDNALNLAAAKTKGLMSQVAGHAEILIAPNIESGNMMAKDLIHVAEAEAGGIVVGAKVPIILTSRADDARTRLVSCALAVCFDRHRN